MRRSQGSVGTEAAQPPEGPHVGLLQRVVHPVAIASEQPEGEGAHPIIVASHQVRERASIAVQYPFEEALVRVRWRLHSFNCRPHVGLDAARGPQLPRIPASTNTFFAGDARCG